MYLKKVSIKNIKSIKELEIDFDAPYYGWHVLLGDNGAGKSTILKAIALGLIGERQAYSLKENYKNWVTKNTNKPNGASCNIQIINEKYERIKSIIPEESSSTLKMLGGKDTSKGVNAQTTTISFSIKKNGDINNQVSILGKDFIIDSKEIFNQSEGWYSASFGPFRRIGSLETQTRSKSTEGNLQNHITLFDPNYNLTGAVEWLKELKFQELESSIPEEYFERIINFINKSGLLPNNVSIEKVSSKGVFFKDGNNKDISINELSDGYQSIFSLTIEILRQISNSFDLSEILKSEDGDFYVDAPGVILIDEVDIHLHPKWQAKIGEWFKKYFPKIQFIVTTHSPIICQSAEGASIWKIEHSKNEKPSRRVVGQDFNRLVYGNVLDAFGTDNFGEELVGRSEKSKEMLDKLAKLNMKSIRGLASDSEKEELKKLQSILPSQ